jgi:hypothetical protein
VSEGFEPFRAGGWNHRADVADNITASQSVESAFFRKSTLLNAWNLLLAEGLEAAIGPGRGAKKKGLITPFRFTSRSNS